ncbi:MAG: FlgB family protein [Paracoccaceae bacterium]|nr:FlgB family protein [Paracoccaceae bacterium]
MFTQIELLRMAGELAENAAARQNAISRNIANANTPGYKAVGVTPFSESYRESDDFAMRRSLPGHISDIPDPTDMAPKPRKTPGAESPNGNTVSLEAEMVRAADAKHQNDMAVSVYRSASNILRITLGVAK